MHFLTFFFIFLGLVGQFAVGQDVAVGKIADDSALRNRVKDAWFFENPVKVLAQPRTLYRLAGGDNIELRAEAAQNEFMVIFAREHNNSGKFPGWAQGSWVLTRRKDTGEATRIRVFLRSDFNTYVQFRPLNADKCLMDVVLYDAFMVRSLPLPVSFDRLYTMPLDEVLHLAGNKFPRKYFEPNPANYREQRLLIANIRKKLPELRYVNDGAMDQAGQYVYIDSGLEQSGQPGLNCSGFTKWLIDGILRPVTGERLAIPPLKAPFGDRGSSFTEAWEELRDPFFGLDWIRNLAAQAGTTLYSPAFGNIHEIEVRQEPFSQVILRGKNNSIIHSYPGFLEYAGYGVEGLWPLLYTLAIDEPNRFFLAAVNNEMSGPPPKSNPRRPILMRQYFHVMAFIPYFTENGIFQVAVFESASETSFSAFRHRYPVRETIVNGEKRLYPNGHYVSLVRVPIETTFDP
ncbi:MAG: hypothetical protein FWD36_03725 [Treponema sp.]|nr:hypothetical protein [Treponema sp.]